MPFYRRTNCYPDGCLVVLNAKRGSPTGAAYQRLGFQSGGLKSFSITHPLGMAVDPPSKSSCKLNGPFGIHS